MAEACANTVRKAKITSQVGLMEVKISMDDLEIFADLLLERVFFNLLQNSVIHGKKVTHINVHHIIEGDIASSSMKMMVSGYQSKKREHVLPDRREHERPRDVHGKTDTPHHRHRIFRGRDGRGRGQVRDGGSQRLLAYRTPSEDVLVEGLENIGSLTSRPK